MKQLEATEHERAAAWSAMVADSEARVALALTRLQPAGHPRPADKPDPFAEHVALLREQYMACRCLLVAVWGRAKEDAASGDVDAQEWLATTGARPRFWEPIAAASTIRDKAAGSWMPFGNSVGALYDTWRTLIKAPH